MRIGSVKEHSIFMNTMENFLADRTPRQIRSLVDIPNTILTAIKDINRILNYAGSAHPIMVYGKSGTGKTLAIEQLAAHIQELPSIKKRGEQTPRCIKFLTSDAMFSFRANDDSWREFVLLLNKNNEDRHISIVCNDFTIAKSLIVACPNTSIIVEMSEYGVEQKFANDKDNFFEAFEAVHIDADMEWNEALHEIRKSNERFSREYALKRMSDQALKTFISSLMRCIYPSRKSLPCPHEHIDIPIGYIIQQMEFAYAKSMEKPYDGRRITPNIANKIALESFDDSPYYDGESEEGLPAESSLYASFDDDSNKINDIKPDDIIRYKDPIGLASRLKLHVINQDESIDMVEKSIMIDAAHLKPRNKPVSSFLFIGPSGVGKTQLVQSLADELCDKPLNLVRIDCSEFSEKHMVSRLFGAPPGYKGSSDGGELTNAIRIHPQSIVLLDEAEKAHPDVWDSFLQVFDSARLTDGQGITTDFSHCVIIMTGNIGSTKAHQRITGFGDTSIQDKKSTYVEAMRRYFKPEFINRLDGICVFNDLRHEDYTKILELKISSLEHIINQQYNKDVTFSIDDGAMDIILRAGQKNDAGARGFDRALKELVVLPLAYHIVSKDIDISMAQRLLVSSNGNNITIDTESIKDEND
jgi:DNA polymerase III delta prime subunit